jgi:hypothetical protein
VPAEQVPAIISRLNYYLLAIISVLQYAWPCGRHLRSFA